LGRKYFQKKSIFQESVLVLKKGQARDCPFFVSYKESWEGCLPYWVGNNMIFYDMNQSIRIAA
jgi:hypothetical protein